MYRQRLTRAFHSGPITLPDINELLRLQRAMAAEFAGSARQATWTPLNMQRLVVDDVIYIQETAEQLNGRGLFAIREQTDSRPLLIQAPHAQYDKYTGVLAAQLFAEGGLKAAMWNTVSRYARIKDRSNHVTADMAHLTGTYWQAITELFAQHYRNGRVVQLHGFKQSTRHSTAGKNSDIILSAGHYYPPRWVRSVARCLKTFPGSKVSLFPDDVRELGATTNAQSHRLQQLGFKGFLHVEMSGSMRQQLINSRKLRQQLVDCLQ